MDGIIVKRDPGSMQRALWPLRMQP
jgi:hypothetical protein